MSHEKSEPKSIHVGHAAPAAAPTPPVTPPGDMLPGVAVPATPQGWKATPAKGRGKTRGHKLRKDQASAQAAAAGELGSPTYVADFGSHAPSQSVLAFLLANAAGWRAMWQEATQFLDYAAEQRQKWEDAAAVEMATLAPSFQFVTSRAPAVAQKYAATAKYLGAASAVAKRGAATRKVNDKAKAKQVEAASPAPVAATPAADAGGAGKSLN